MKLLNRPPRDLNPEDPRGVSPVIGIVLMVAVTVILAAIVGSFVLDIGQSAEEDSPQASFQVSVDPAADEIELTHMGGDELRHDETIIIVESDGRTRFDAVDGGGAEAILSVGETALITLNNSSVDSLDFDSDGTIDATTDGAADPFDPDEHVTVTLIDMPTQRIIMERSILVRG